MQEFSPAAADAHGVSLLSGSGKDLDSFLDIAPVLCYAFYGNREGWK